MTLFDTLRISGSGLTAERLRMDVAAANIANAQTTRTPTGGPYQPEAVVFAAVPVGATPTSPVSSLRAASPGDPALPGVVAVALVPQGRAPLRVYDPGHPDADPQGYVTYPGVDVGAEVADAMGAARAYSLNAAVIAEVKAMAQETLDLGR
jgi:flagellar basal-body rod protein FlgC